MLTGIWTFPWYFTTLAAWMWITLGLMVTGWFVMYWIGPGAVLGLTAQRLFGLPACAAGLLTFGYAATCCLAIIVETSHGNDAVELSVAVEWKEWVWNFAHIAVLVLEAGAVGYVVRLACFSDSWLLVGIVTFYLSARVARRLGGRRSLGARRPAHRALVAAAARVGLGTVVPREPPPWSPAGWRWLSTGCARRPGRCRCTARRSGRPSS